MDCIKLKTSVEVVVLSNLILKRFALKGKGLFESYLNGNSLVLWLSPPNMTQSKRFNSFLVFSCRGFFCIHFVKESNGIAQHLSDLRLRSGLIMF